MKRKEKGETAFDQATHGPARKRKGGKKADF